MFRHFEKRKISLVARTYRKTRNQSLHSILAMATLVFSNHYTISVVYFSPDTTSIKHKIHLK